MLRGHRVEHPRNETVIAVGGWPCSWAGLLGAISARRMGWRFLESLAINPGCFLFFVAVRGRSSYAARLLIQSLILLVLVPTRQRGKFGRDAFAHLALSVTALAFLADAPAFAESNSARDRAIGSSPAQDIVWTDNQDSSACPKRPVWTIMAQGTTLLLKTRNFDYQVVPIALRGDGSASMDHVIQPGRNVKYRISGTFDGHGRMRLRLEDLAREGRPCSWRLEAEYQDGIVPGVKAARSRNP